MPVGSPFIRRPLIPVAAAAVVLITAAAGLFVTGGAPAGVAVSSKTVSVEIRYVDVGQGDGVVLRVGKTIVVSDAGQNNPDRVDAALQALGAKAIDYAILSHPHRDHVANFLDLINRYGWKIKTVVLSHSDYWQGTDTNKQLISDLATHGAKFLYVKAGDTFTWGGGSWEILSPPAGKYTGPADAADSSVVYLLRVKQTEVLFTGDIGPAVAKQVAARWTSEQLGRAAIYLATHHGSAQGSAQTLLDAIQPQWAVLSTGPNSYHHPTLAAIKRLELSGASIWCTDTNGTITADFNGTSAIAWHAGKQAAPWWDATTKTETGSCVGR